MFNLTINGKAHAINVAPDTPLLWVIREKAGLTGTKFGCGAGLCGACTVHLNGKAVRSCQTPISKVGDATVTTIEGLDPAGQHIGTALSQALAEELDCGWDNIDIDYVGFDPRFGLHITGGSWSVNWTFDALSRAGAAGRMALIEAAAAELGGNAADYNVADGVISGNGKQITYGELAAKGITPRQFTEDALKALTLKPADYGIDVVLDGMVYATPAVPPLRYGASVKSVDDSAAKDIPGYLRHVVINDPLGTQTGWVMAVADSYWTAKKAAEALKIDYDHGPNAGVSLADIHAESDRLLDGDGGRR